jgi:hypothetical protein
MHSALCCNKDNEIGIKKKNYKISNSGAKLIRMSGLNVVKPAISPNK